MVLIRVLVGILEHGRIGNYKKGGKELLKNHNFCCLVD